MPMLDELDLRNIKDLLESTILASEKRVKTELRAEIKATADNLEAKLSAQIDELSSSVAEALEITNSSIDEISAKKAKQAVKKHELRFHGLQTKAA
jgi:hypothetical protein